MTNEPLLNEPPPKRRRNRVTVVCQRCRKKKAKCDKQLPCGQCIRAQCASECSYDMPNSPDFTDLELDPRLKSIIRRSVAFGREQGTRKYPEAHSVSCAPNNYMIGEIPLVPATDVMNMHMGMTEQPQFSENGDSLNPPAFIEPRFVHVFHNFKTSQRNTYLVALSQQDPAIQIYWANSVISEKLKLMTVQCLDASKQNDVVKAASRHFGPLFLSSNRLPRAMTRTQLSMYGHPIAFTLHPSFDENDTFQVSIRKLLPRKPVLEAYLRRFFARIYPFYPIVDEMWLFSQVARLFNYSDPTGDFVSANLTSREDVIAVAMVLFMLRLAYLSFFTNVRVHNEKLISTVKIGDTLLKDSPISADVVELANSMLSKGRSRTKSSFILLQAYTLKMISKILSPDNETAHCSLDGILGTGSLSQMALSLMLNRDPDHIVNFPGDSRERNLRRKLWFVLVNMDYMTAYLFLIPKAICKNTYRTKLPTFDADSSNIIDLDLEEETIKQLSSDYEIFTAGNPLLNLAVDVSLCFNTAHLVQHLSEFENLVKEKFGVIDDYFINLAPTNDRGSRSISRLRTLVGLRLFLSYINYFLYLYYKWRKNQKLSFFFLKKTVLFYMNEFAYLSSELMYSLDKYFDVSFVLIMTPLIMVVRQATFIASSALSLSLQCSLIVQNILNDRHRDTHLMRALLQKTRHYTLQVQKSFKLLGERYFYGWKCAKINSFGYKSALEPDFFMLKPEKLSQAALLYSDAQYLELLGCIRDESPIEVSDPETFKTHCYQNITSGNDADLEGVDLYKTLQTENFWIVLNTLAEREYASSYLNAEQNPQSEVGTSARGSVTSIERDGTPTRRAPSLSLFDPTNNAAHLEPSTLQILDMNLFSANWKAEDTFNGEATSSYEKAL